MNYNMIQFECSSNPPLEVDWLDAYQMRIRCECTKPNLKRIRCTSNPVLSASVSRPLDLLCLLCEGPCAHPFLVWLPLIGVALCPPAWAVWGSASMPTVIPGWWGVAWKGWNFESCLETVALRAFTSQWNPYICGQTPCQTVLVVQFWN